MMDHFDYLARVADAILRDKVMPAFPMMPSFKLTLDGFVEPKERPRSGKNGHFYTPTDTRKYEKRVKEAAADAMSAQRLSCFTRPVVVHLSIRDPIPSQTPDWKRRLMYSRLLFTGQGGDLDNKEKAILDALNGVVFKDDRLVIQVYKHRMLENKAGFDIVVTPAGLTEGDLVNIEKLLKNGQESGQKEASKR